MPKKLRCPLSGNMAWCKKEECAFWDPDMSYKGNTGGCLVVRVARDLGEINARQKARDKKK